jgi:hypothetical protein
MPLCHILRARLRQQGKGDKSTLPVRDNSTLRLQSQSGSTGVMEWSEEYLQRSEHRATGVHHRR